ncbi:ABC transporter permease [Paeniglutamicibacter gangotriensis]|uniref:ABC transporter integral membrane protein n=2 Tax=Paeniglutamicibacter gangotriensis TaxID=254787 RepID=M7MZ79_9MICC|nr:ABC transporter permease [Paeniglutamicibacter gangotriensis]EMR00352.1 ABC transporter integral membrane protein [Paeniglutamicibacter gangotriensis Lz1y]KAA0979237.1 ABC transporter permease [Paeniglutamicibacter gangotriensis]
MTQMTESSTRAAAKVKVSRAPSKGWPKWVLGLIGIVVFLGFWELMPILGVVQAKYLPPASEVIAALIADLGFTAFWVAVGDTLLAWAIGLVIAVVAALILGLVIGMSPFLRRFSNSSIEFLRPIPSVALIPLAVLLFGIKIESSLLLIVYACFWQVLIQVLYGVADVDNVAMQTAKSYGFSYVQRVRDVVFPTMLPYLMTGIRLAASVALILAITAELLIGSPGLGREIALAQSGGAISGMYALILATGFLGVAINSVTRIVEKRVLSWHPSVRGEATV